MRTGGRDFLAWLPPHRYLCIVSTRVPKSKFLRRSIGKTGCSNRSEWSDWVAPQGVGVRGRFQFGTSTHLSVS
ncbi:hypothetical protein Pla100_09650 [Neorhodopirellula pilleata]|uniref:Uncharacterized protein n=1 Tax=Neorhodopirellula pilleata TaxID=2714738 RepID=A0A5C6AXX3_9BACT|nr:hypothetical protein Pla100_09650 [Neorhodopirellula pilleata]